MKLKKLTIRNLLLTSSVVIALILISIALTTNWHIKDSFSDHQLMRRLEQLYSHELFLKQTEKDFLIYETINPKFFEKGESEYLNSITTLLEDIQKELTLLKEEARIHDLQLEHEINTLGDKFKSYKNELNKLSILIRKKGFKDYGLIGDMRNSIHKLEDELAYVENDSYLVKMLMLRRHEKDYLLRKDLKYKHKFSNTINAFTQMLKKDPMRQNLILDLAEYQSYFHKVIETDLEIGIAEDQGLMKQHKGLLASIEADILNIRNTVQEASVQNIQKTIYTLFAIFIALSLFIILILHRVSRFIVRSIKTLREYITRLGEGELPEEIKVHNDDEIANIKRSINTLTKNLKNTREFAIAVGNGNFEKDIDVFNNKGDLGGSLVEMRKKLLQVANDRKEQEQKDQQRIWVNEGVALFSDILRENINSQSDMYKKILSSLVNYVGASQGGLFLTEEADDTTELVLKATYAFSRDKYAKRSIKPGESLIGECYLEQKSIFLTEIPKNYDAISVGLGGFKPQSVYIVPLVFDKEVVGIIELASTEIFNDITIDFIDRTAIDIASYLSVSRINLKTQMLLEQSKAQAAELVSNKEELAQNLEEMSCVQENYESKEKEMNLEIASLKAELSRLKLVAAQEKVLQN